MIEHLTLALSRNEAVVLFEWIARFISVDNQKFEDQSEQRVLWDIESMLESKLVEPFKPEYCEILSAARSRIRDPIN